MKQLREHQTGEDDEVQAGQHRRRPLVIADEAAEVRVPREVPLSHPASRSVGRVAPAGAGSWVRFYMAYSYSVSV